MRLRHIPGSEARVSESPCVISDPQACKGRFREIFGNGGPLEIEIGMGKGRFLMEMAAAHPLVNYIGIERTSSVLIKAVEKLEERKSPNVRLLYINAREIGAVFAPGEVDRIYLNFSDPWPKDRHENRRLTSPAFLALYAGILSPAGTVVFKTDNQTLFDYSLGAAEANGWRVLACTRDLHHSEFAPDNVMTEYEMKFSALGRPICMLTVRPARAGGAAGSL